MCCWVLYLDNRLHDDRHCNRCFRGRRRSLVKPVTVSLRAHPTVECAHVKQSASASSRQRQGEDPFSFRGLKALLLIFCEGSPWLFERGLSCSYKSLVTHFQNDAWSSAMKSQTRPRAKTCSNVNKSSGVNTKQASSPDHSTRRRNIYDEISLH